MTKTLTDLKREAREEFKILLAKHDEGDEVDYFFPDVILDRLLEEVEKAVVPEPLRVGDGTNQELLNRKKAYNECRDDVLEAFKKFRNQ